MIAGRARERGLTQVQITETFGVSQQQGVSSEMGRRSVRSPHSPVSLRPSTSRSGSLSVARLSLGVSQQFLSSEKRSRRVPVSTAPALAQALGVTIEELLGTEAQPAKRGPTPKLRRQLERLQGLPRSQQRFVSQMLDTVLQQTAR